MKIMYVTIIVDNMEESVEFYTNVLGFEVDEVFNLPAGVITLLSNGNETGFELIENNAFKTGFYSVGLDVEDINKELESFRKKDVEIAMEPTKISVGIMARVIDPNGVNIVLIQHED
jgi:lactoylglutathione lyase